MDDLRAVLDEVGPSGWRSSREAGVPLGDAWSRRGARPPTAALRGCSVRAGAHLLCSPRRRAPFGLPQPSASCRFTLAVSLQSFGSIHREPAGSCWATWISERASCMRCPGSGSSAPVGQRLRSLVPAWAIRRGCGVSAAGRWWRACLRRHGNLAGEPKWRDAAISTCTKAAEGPNRVALEGGVIEEFRRSGRRPVKVNMAGRCRNRLPAFGASLVHQNLLLTCGNAGAAPRREGCGGTRGACGFVLESPSSAQGAPATCRCR